MGISTAINPNAIAAGVGIKTINERFGGIISKLDTRIAILAQHLKGVIPATRGFSYDSPFQITSAKNAADVFGFGSPVHLAALRLYNPKQSIGTIPVDVYAIKESDSGKSKGSLTIDLNIIDADDMLVDAKTYTFQTTLTDVDGNIKIGATLAETQANIIAAFSLSGAAGIDYAASMTAHPTVDIAAFAADIAILTAKDSGVAGDTIATTENFTGVTNVFDAVTLGTVQAGSNTTAAGALSFTGTQTLTQDYTLKIGSELIPFTIVKGETALQAATKVKALIDADVDLPLNAGDIAGDAIPLTAKWAGITGNEIGIELEGLTQGLPVAITPMIGGIGSPSIVNAINNFTIFYTDVINAFGDTASLDALEVRNEELWGSQDHSPFLAYYGSSEADATVVSSDTNTRLNERTNVKFPVPGSPSLGVDIAASIVALVASTKNADAAKPYYDAAVFGITAGASTVSQWDFVERDFIVKRGCSTSYINNGLIIVGDVVTTYHPVGDDNPGYRYAVDIAKLQLMLTDLDKLFKGDKWVQKILVGNRDRITNPNARKPSNAKQDVWDLIDTWANDAVVVDRDFLKDNTFVEIDPNNSKRLNVVVPSILSGDARQRSIDLKFSTEVGGN